MNWKKLSSSETLLAEKFKKLKLESGSHSPSIFTFLQELPELKIHIDACFLSNPYATELFLNYLNDEVLSTGKIRDLLEFYPSQNRVLAALLSDFLKVDSGNIFIGNGAIEIIQAVLHRFASKKLLINIPTFSSYYEFVPDGCEVVFNKLKKENNYEINCSELIDKIYTEKPDTIVIINPNNPNGAYLNFGELEMLLDSCSKVENVILDESFIHFAYEDKNFNLINTAGLVHKYPNIIIVKSMSKDFGIAGVRAGYAVMDKEKVDLLLMNGFLWNSNGFAEYFFRLYTRADFAYKYENVRLKYIMETIDFMKNLREIAEIKLYSSKANFAMIEMLDGTTADELMSYLLIKHGIYVRNCSDKIGLDGEFLRVASRNKEQNQLIVSAIREFYQT